MLVVPGCTRRHTRSRATAHFLKISSFSFRHATCFLRYCTSHIMAEYEDEQRDDYRRSVSPDRYDRRSMSPRRDDDYRDEPSNGNGEPRDDRKEEDDEEDRNEGTNLFVTGLSRAVSEQQLREMFEKYGEVEKCQIMVDPHSRESRGFGFVNMTDVSAAETASRELTGLDVSGRTLSVEKARRKRPRTPTPGKYFGPPKARRGGRGGYPPRFDDRYPRGGGDRYYGRPPSSSRFDDRRYDEYRRPSRYDDRDSRDRFYRDRGGYGRYDDRERYPPSREYRDRYERPAPRDIPPPPGPRDDRPPYRDDRYVAPPPGDYGREDYR
jgi:RNA recognition motif-containing protein